jgi:hypothetical protein
MSNEVDLEEVWAAIENLRYELDDLHELITYIQDHRNTGSLGDRLVKLEEAVFGDRR